MNALLRKEIRMIAPAWIGALLLATIPALFVNHTEVDGKGLTAVGIGILLLTLASFGSECSSGTLSMFLAQPVPRKKLWNLKALVLAIALISVVGFFQASWSYKFILHGDAHRLFIAVVISGLIAACAYSGALWTTLLLRQTAGALWLTVVVPGGITGLVLGVSQFLGIPREGEKILVLVLLAYSLVGFWFARQLFLTAQDAHWTGGNINLPAWRMSKATRKGSTPGRRIFVLLEKEMQLHQMTLIFAVVGIVLELASILLRKLSPDAPHDSFVANSWILPWFCWMCLPVMTGAVAVAEERKLGTLEGQLCLPVSRLAQFIAKLGVVVALSTTLGFLLPFVMEWSGMLLGVKSQLFDNHEVWTNILWVYLWWAFVGWLAFYASTLGRNTLQGLGIAVGACFISGLVCAAAMNTKEVLGWEPWRGPLFVYLGSPIVIIITTWLAYWNFKRQHPSQTLWVRNIATLAAALALAVTATAITYHRTWELLTPTEPAHGPARIQDTGKAKIAYTYFERGGYFVLLPDGRLWKSTDREAVQISEDWTLYLPRRGEFSGSNWVDLAASFYEAAGIQADGSLWLLSDVHSHARETPTRIGTNSNWVMLTAGYGCLLALQRDGSLWGWGDTSSGLLGAQKVKRVTEPVRIGNDTDWARISAQVSTIVATKRDGSVWRWGRLNPKPGEWQGLATEPERWDIPGGGFASLKGWDIFQRTNGTLWRIISTTSNDAVKGFQFTEQIRQMPTDSNWREFAAWGDCWIGIKESGELWGEENITDDTYVFHPRSTWTDWVTVAAPEGCYAALARDGTLCVWLWPKMQDRELLRSTRRPLVSLNILDAAR